MKECCTDSIHSGDSGWRRSKNRKNGSTEKMEFDEVSCRQLIHLTNKCPDRIIEVKLVAIFGNYVRPTNPPTPCDGQDGKLNFQLK